MITIDPNAVETIIETGSDYVTVGLRSGYFFDAVGEYRNIKQKIEAAK